MSDTNITCGKCNTQFTVPGAYFAHNCSAEVEDKPSEIDNMEAAFNSLLKCECGVDKLGAGLHSSYCPKVGIE